MGFSSYRKWTVRCDTSPAKQRLGDLQRANLGRFAQMDCDAYVRTSSVARSRRVCYVEARGQRPEKPPREDSL